MKEKLFVLTALVILSSINGIFFNMPVGISAQQFTMDDPTKTGNNEIGVFTGDKKHGDKKFDDKKHFDKKHDDKQGKDMKDFKKYTCPSGIIVDKQENCPQVCPSMSALAGHLVAAGSNLEQVCNDEDNLGEVCTGDVDLPGVIVENAPEDCNIYFTCPGPDQPTDIANPNFFLAGAKVTDPRLCQAATPAVQCGDLTDLAGVWVAPGKTESCDIENGDGGVTEAEVQCLKCADLSIWAVEGNAQDNVANAFIGDDVNDNVFTVCASDEVVTEFNELIDGIPNNQLNANGKAAVKGDFDTCISNAEGPDDAFDQTETLSMTENSLTTNVAPEPEIPTTSSPSDQQTGDLSLIPQWLMEEFVE
ncbi:MAG: hypothetical protein MRJ93_11400 [Nitrososphaeraceae archaeon]|nr:hypothetical protein [Nitrososphaeraceae archaeon]